MEKYDLLPRQLLLEGIISESDLFSPGFPDKTSLLTVHTEPYVDSLMNLSLDSRAVRKIGFPLSAQLIERELRITQGTISGCQRALETKIAFNIAGGTHHAYSGHGEAFCLLNDQAVAASFLLTRQLASRILIIDLDVHQGNGTAEIFKDNERVFTFSMHGKSNYPFRKEVSDLDIALGDGTGDIEYLEILSETLPQLIENHHPDFIFYLSGVDILGSDKLGKLNCTIKGCRQRDHIVFSVCKKFNIPVQCSMGGGYSPEIKIILEAHTNTYREAAAIF